MGEERKHKILTRISEENRQRLCSLREYPRESYNDTITKMFIIINNFLKEKENVK